MKAPQIDHGVAMFAVRCMQAEPVLWGGWGSNPRPRDYEVFQGAFPTCTIISDLASDLGIYCWRLMAVDGLKRPFCGHRVGTADRRTGQG